jgi:hypothetical protein
MASFFNTWLPHLFNVLTTPPNDSSPSPASQIAGSLAGLSAAASNKSVLPSLEFQEELKNSALRNVLARNQQQMQQANAAREQNLTDAQVRHLNAETAGLTNPQPKPKEEQWDELSGYTGPNGEPILRERNSGALKVGTGVQGLKPAAPKQEGELALGDKAAQYNSMLTQRYGVLHSGQQLPDAYKLTPASTEKDYANIAASLGGEESAAGTQAQRQFNNSLAKERLSNSEAKAEKPTADEQKRADLAANMRENLNQLEDIVNRRPELFGKFEGRLTQLKQWAGTDDQDVAKLQTISEFFGQAALGAHGMRSALHIEQSARALTNAYKNSPDALRGSIAAARNSLQTFIDDASGNRTASQPAPATGGSKPAANNRPPLSSFEH